MSKEEFLEIFGGGESMSKIELIGAFLKKEFWDFVNFDPRRHCFHHPRVIWGKFERASVNSARISRRDSIDI